MAYDQSDYEREDTEALRLRRAALRAFVQDVAEAVQALPLPETYLEAERAARAVTVADRITQKLGTETLGGEDEEDTPPPPRGRSPSPWNGAEKESLKAEKAPTTITSDAPPPHEWGGIGDATTPINDTKRMRLRLRAYADRVMEAASLIPKPDSFLEGERAGRYASACEHMLTQLYAPPPKTKAPRFARDGDGRDDAPTPYVRPGSEWVEEEGMFQWQLDLEQKLIRLARARLAEAESTGFWDDGRPFIAEDPYSNWPPNPETGREAGPRYVPP